MYKKAFSKNKVTGFVDINKGGLTQLIKKFHSEGIVEARNGKLNAVYEWENEDFQDLILHLRKHDLQWSICYDVESRKELLVISADIDIKDAVEYFFQIETTLNHSLKSEIRRLNYEERFRLTHGIFSFFNGKTMIQIPSYLKYGNWVNDFRVKTNKEGSVTNSKPFEILYIKSFKRKEKSIHELLSYIRSKKEIGYKLSFVSISDADMKKRMDELYFGINPILLKIKKSDPELYSLHTSKIPENKQLYTFFSVSVFLTSGSVEELNELYTTLCDDLEKMGHEVKKYRFQKNLVLNNFSLLGIDDFAQYRSMRSPILFAEKSPTEKRDLEDIRMAFFDEDQDLEQFII